MKTPSDRTLWFGLAAILALLGWSAWQPHDYATWAMEVAPVAIVAPILIATHRRFPLTGLVYTLIALHAVILMVGGHYTYAKVPLGFWMADWFGWTRNNYDKMGHIAQGFVPAMVVREVLLRRSVLRRGGWCFLLVTASCLAISALYEFIEWGAALALGSGAEEFLATQGDPWDTQSDMFAAWIGAMVAQGLLASWHDRQLAAIRRGDGGAGPPR